MAHRRLISAICLSILLPTLHAKAQSSEPAPSAPEKPSPQGESSTKRLGGKHQHDFLIKGTIFTEAGLSFPGARVQIRKEGGKKFHWQDSTNSRGEFAIRVLQGAKYEVVVSGKGCKVQKKIVDTTRNERVEEMVFHMEREGNKPS